jgi:hypothetical protein
MSPNVPALAPSLAFLGTILGLLGQELYQAFQSKGKGTTLTTDWRFADAWLNKHAPWADAIYRIVTVGFLVLVALHFATGARII